MSELGERLADLQERIEQVEPLTDRQAKARFLENLCEGMTPSEAGRKADRTASWFRRRRNPEAESFDPEFAAEYTRIMTPGGEYRAAIVDDVFTAMLKSAKDGNVRAQEKILSAYSEEFAFLRPQIASGDLNVQQLQVFFGELPLEKLLELKEARDRAKMRELPFVDA